jgi:hypothetical protein
MEGMEREKDGRYEKKQELDGFACRDAEPRQWVSG